MDSRFQGICEAAALTWKVPALTVGITSGDTVQTFAVGCESDTRFRIASVTKPCTTTLALELLNLEETPGVWQPDVRIRHLLSHTSGYDCELAERDLGRFGDGDDALAAAIAELPSVRRFVGVEQAWSYANTGYWLVGWLCAERAGSTYEDALTARVLRPAGLEATAFDEPELAGTGPDAGEGPYPRARRPSGGLVSNVADMLRLARWHLASPAAARMRIVHGKPSGGVYGLGLAGERVGDVEVWGHRGSYDGFQSSLLVVPDRNAAFAGLTNSGRGGHALREIEDAFFERVLGARRRDPESYELAWDALDSFTGTYANSSEWYGVRLVDDGLAVTRADGEFAARPLGPTTFEITEGDHVRDRFDFPLEGFGRFDSRLAERVE